MSEGLLISKRASSKTAATAPLVSFRLTGSLLSPSRPQRAMPLLTRDVRPTTQVPGNLTLTPAEVAWTPDDATVGGPRVIAIKDIAGGCCT